MQRGGHSLVRLDRHPVQQPLASRCKAERAFWAAGVGFVPHAPGRFPRAHSHQSKVCRALASPAPAVSFFNAWATLTQRSFHHTQNERASGLLLAVRETGRLKSRDGCAGEKHAGLASVGSYGNAEGVSGSRIPRYCRTLCSSTVAQALLSRGGTNFRPPAPADSPFPPNAWKQCTVHSFPLFEIESDPASGPRDA